MFGLRSCPGNPGHHIASLFSGKLSISGSFSILPISTDRPDRNLRLIDIGRIRTG